MRVKLAGIASALIPAAALLARSLEVAQAPQSGATGAQGGTGATGAAGPPGAAGATGATGSAGDAGATGATGATGAGATGAQGATGATGTAGAAGATGATGSGATGATGAAGGAGATGATGSGATGATGVAGADGATGATGAAGSQGATGATGSGATGATGTAGSQGATGATGAGGGQGATGATGTAGTQGATGATGAGGAQGATGATGTAGANGATGATGAGTQGATGATGPVGATGGAGAGDDNTIDVTQTGHGFAVGDVLRVDGANDTYALAQADTAANAEVAGIVSEVADVDNFTLVTCGPIDTLSGLDTTVPIYFLDPAVAGAFTDTEPSTPGEISKPILIPVNATTGIFDNMRGTVVGADAGATGATGAQGTQGATGATGSQGVQGATGATGAQGIQGATGATGAGGAQGATGATGAGGATGATGATGAKTAGQLFLSGAGMWPSTTNGAAANAKVESATNKQNVYVLDFADGATKLFAEATVAMPSDWDGGTVTAEFFWLTNGTGTGGVVWGCAGRSYGDQETLDQAFGTEQTVTDNGVATANQVLKSSATGAITLGGTPAAGELVQFRVSRDPTNGSDTLAQTARLLGVMISYTRT